MPSKRSKRNKSPQSASKARKITVPPLRGTRPLQKASATELRRSATRLFAATALPKTKDGWIAPVDCGLKTEPTLTTTAIQARAAQLQARWADIYFQDLASRINALGAVRLRYAEINSRYTATQLAQLELDGSEKIHADEVAKGWYGLQEGISNQELAGQDAWAKAADKVRVLYENALKSPTLGQWFSNIDLLARLKAWADSVSVYSVYYKVHKSNAPSINSLNDFLWARDPVQNNGAPTIMDPPSGGVGDKKSVPGLVYTYSNWALQLEYLGYQLSLLTQQELARGSALSAAQTTAAKKIIHDWNLLDVDFRRRRSELSLKLKDMRGNALTGEQGPHNDAQYLVGLRAEFVEALADVLARGQVCVTGLTGLWQWGGLVPPPAAGGWNDADGSYFDALSSWFKGLEQRVTAAITREGTGVAALSLKTLAGAAAWSAAMAAVAASQGFSLSLPVSAAAFGSRRGGRIRGVSVYVHGVNDGVSGTWRGTLSVPASAVILDASANPVVQAQPIPAVDIGRALSRTNPKPADIVGTAQLRNASPLSNAAASPAAGYWCVTIEAESSEHTPVTALTDISLDVFYAYQQ